MNNKSVQNLRCLMYCTCIFLFKSDNVERYNFIKSILINLTPFSFISFKSNVFISEPVLSHSVLLIIVKVKGVYQLVLTCFFSMCGEGDRRMWLHAGIPGRSRSRSSKRKHFFDWYEVVTKQNVCMSKLIRVLNIYRRTITQVRK